MPTHEEIEPSSTRIMDAQQLLRQIIDCRDYIKRLCSRFLQNEEDAKDAAQDVLVLALQNLQRFRGESSINTWLYHMAKNHCLNLLSRRKPTSSLEDERHRELSDPEPSVGEAVVDTLFHQQVREAVERKARSRQPPWDSDDYLIYEAYYDDEKRTWPQVAAILGKPVDTVKWHFYNHVLPTLKEVGEELEQS